MMQKQIVIVTVTKGSKTRYFYGEKLNDALQAAALKPGQDFAYGIFKRASVQTGEMRGWRGGSAIYTQRINRREKKAA